MEETIKKTFININDRNLLSEARVAWPTEKTIKEMITDQLGHCIIRSATLDFRIEPVIDETGEEIDAAPTGDVKIALRCTAWGQIKLKEMPNEDEKTEGPG